MLALLLITVPAVVECSNPAETHLLHRGRSAFNEIWVVEDLQGTRRCLQFAPDGGPQSCMAVAEPARLLLPYTRSMVATLALADSPRRVLLVGLGGASIPRFLAPGGVAVMNVLAPAGARSTASPIRAFDQVFPSAAALLPEVTRAARQGLLPGAWAGAAVNHILVARAGGIPVSCADWAVAGARFTSEHGLQDDLGRLVAGECVPLADLSLVGGVP